MRDQRSPERSQEFTVASGNNQDVCPLCGIWRMNAGYLRESCGESFRKPGCFVVAREEKP